MDPHQMVFTRSGYTLFSETDKSRFSRTRVNNFPLSAQQRLSSDWVNDQADLFIHWV